MNKDDDPIRSQKVGYKNPPTHSRFKPGQSGNPKGRKKKALADMNLAELLEKALTEKKKVRVGDKLVTLTPIQASVLAATQKVFKGDLKTTLQMIDYWAKHAWTIEKHQVETRIFVEFVEPGGDVDGAPTKRFNPDDEDEGREN